ncbi:glycosyltransferase family 2 protein [Spiroplasma tabanidicola]|uniref:Glycosyltransferase n=1 Tax=Spiroplasma tabanidicola TaxID=324079 RepID=A0A6I6C7Y8_9MOLU|nr:glycosyltransferase family 2 protein [Spiroplasma tabanidicola]QGS51549.1 glycosyltransferase [Spiroplasma tabanidicola]
MLVSFVLVSEGSLSTIENSLNSILAQTIDDYEIVIVGDNNISDNSEDKELKKKFWELKNCKLVLNSSIQGYSVSWNIAMDLVEGEYLKFIAANDSIEPNFVVVLKENLQKNSKDQIDLIEHLVELDGIGKGISTQNFLENQRIYNLENNYEPFAFLNPILFNKIFRTKLIHEFGFKFRRFVRFDMLFVYKFLGQTKKFLALNNLKMGTRFLEQSKHSAFDIVNQWTHITNYYRRIGKYKLLKDYITYAYYKTLCYVWLELIRLYDNKLLMKKAVSFAERKFSEKREDFIKNNEVFKLKRDEVFNNICEDFNKYLKDLLKTSK